MARWRPEIRAQTFKFGREVWDPSHRFETSWLLPPWIVFGARAFIAFYCFATIFFVIGWQGTGHDGYTLRDVGNSFSFFTDLTFWGIAFYYTIASIHTFSYALNGGTPLLNRFPRPLQALHYLFWTTIVTFPPLVTIVYWAILYSDLNIDNTFSLWSNVSRHGLNSAFALFELLLTRINPAPWIHLPFLILILAAYLGLAYLTHATKGFYPYNFLNPTPREEVNGENIGGWGTGGVVGVCFGIALGIIVLFCLMKGLATLRKWFTETKLGKQGKFYAGRRMGAGEVELETQRVWEKSPSH